MDGLNMQVNFIKGKNCKLGNIPKEIIQNLPRNTKKKIYILKKRNWKTGRIEGKELIS